MKSTMRIVSTRDVQPVTVTTDITTWVGGQQSRPLLAQRPCPCGCDERGGREIIGYVSASNDKGEGITIYAPDEATYQQFAKVFGEAIG